MADYGGRILKNARILTKEEINEKYPDSNDSRMAKITRRFVGMGYDILYGESPHPKPGLGDDFGHGDILETAAMLYRTQPECVKGGIFTDMSKDNAIYAAVKLKYGRK